MSERQRRAARAALSELPAPSSERGVIGLGSGSTVRYFLEELAQRVAHGHRYVGVPTSMATRALATELGIELLDDEGPWDIAVNVDGADEIDPDCNVIKGGGAAHTREKLVNQAARRNVIIADEAKLSPALGTQTRVPIEVLPFGHRTTARHLARYGEPRLRATTTDNGNVLYDLAIEPTNDPRALESALRAFPGVVEVGLFVDRIDVVILGGADGVRTLRRPSAK